MENIILVWNTNNYICGKRHMKKSYVWHALCDCLVYIATSVNPAIIEKKVS